MNDLNQSQIVPFKVDMDTRFPRSRLIVTLIGLYAGFLLLDTVFAWINGPQRGCAVNSYGGFSWGDEPPLVSFLLALTWQTLAFGGTMLLWFRPRVGYLVAGLGYQLYLTLTLVDFL